MILQLILKIHNKIQNVVLTWIIDQLQSVLLFINNKRIEEEKWYVNVEISH